MDLSINDDGNNGEQLPSYASLPSEDDEDYVPNSNCSMSKTSSDILRESADVQSDSDTDSDDEQLSNAASFTWNNDFMEQESSDDEGLVKGAKELQAKKRTVGQTSGNVGPTAGTRFGTATSARVELEQHSGHVQAIVGYYVFNNKKSTEFGSNKSRSM
ncbi:hypothetical protein QYF36_002735 [Acer negundo]|nr:hypothetical protein QYF36_002735 [Acer negundo]